VAGGDGTVGKVARNLAGTRTPIAILPAGTANNIAKTLGISGKPFQRLIRGWSTARSVNFDAGMADGPWGHKCFIEGFGTGFFAEAMPKLDAMKNANRTDSRKPGKDINSAWRILHKQLERSRAKKLTVRLDGKDFSGDYLLLETLNIRYLGPNLELVPKAQINDGFFDVAFITNRERPKFSRYLIDRSNGKRGRANLAIRRCRHLEIKLARFPVHIDDETWPKGDNEMPVRPRTIHIKVQSAAFVVLL
jgi:diacylglycerol kinase (ATP)